MDLLTSRPSLAVRPPEVPCSQGRRRVPLPPQYRRRTTHNALPLAGPDNVTDCAAPRPRLLLISPVFPDPNGAGREKRACQWTQKLEESYEVHMLVVLSGSQAPPDHAMLRLHPRLRYIHASPKEHSRGKQLCQALVSLCSGQISHASLSGWPTMGEEEQEQLRTYYSGMKLDKIVCFRLYLREYAVYLQRLTSCPAMELDLDDMESSTHYKIARLYRQEGQWPRSLLYMLRGMHFKREEERMGRDFEAVYVCSEEDQALLQHRLPQLRLQVMPNRLAGTPVRLPLPDTPRSLLFIGSLDYFPNEEAVSWLLREVLPRLRRVHSAWTLHVAGHTSSETLRRWLNDSEGVHYYGRVERVEEVYRPSYIVVSPLHAGGGTKLKILEAMGFGRPIVATGESVYGLGLTPQEHYVPAETAGEFAAACERLAESPELAFRLSDQARQVFIEKYTFEMTDYPGGSKSSL
ncbi:glycosyltransferase [Paenibacillus sp. F411]|uniref:glycosyltransferase n=1 Tax=Paenibacillus sp. F411 TaxID=2820239 RepID=UPI001AAF3866|nr:glycosyltransferase [Paenibacillus sp. F411]MBO2944556.1 glycosyltransferase [Paenibacillus sp. F411]